MRKSSVLNDMLPSEIEEFNKVTEAMRKNRIKRHGVKGDVDGYLDFLDESQDFFSRPALKNRLLIGNSLLL